MIEQRKREKTYLHHVERCIGEGWQGTGSNINISINADVLIPDFDGWGLNAHPTQ